LNRILITNFILQFKSWPTFQSQQQQQQLQQQHRQLQSKLDRYITISTTTTTSTSTTTTAKTIPSKQRIVPDFERSCCITVGNAGAFSVRQQLRRKLVERVSLSSFSDGVRRIRRSVERIKAQLQRIVVRL
jgi:hypothetical protein